MSKSIPPIKIEVLPKYSSLNVESAKNFYRAKHNTLLLKNRIINPFEELLKVGTGYGKDNLPPSKKVKALKIGEYKFTITSELTTKRPSLSTVYEKIISYLGFLKSGHKDDVRRKGVLTINDKPYTTVDDIINQITNLREKVLDKGIKQTIKYEGPNNYDNFVMISVEDSINLNESGSLLYSNANNIVSLLTDETAKPFEESLKSQSPYNKDNIPNEMKENWISIGEFLFNVKITPEATVKYADIINSLIKQTKRITSTTGELILLRNKLDIHSNISELYQPINKKDRIYISITGALDRLEQIKTEKTNPSINTKIEFYPSV